MCISAAIIAGASLAIATVGTIATIDNANYQASMVALQTEEQNKQLREQKKFEQLRAREQELARLREFRQMREANLLAMAGSGVGQNMSWLQGGYEADKKALQLDLGNIRIGMLSEQNRLANQIQVNNTESMMARQNANSQNIGALVNYAGKAVGVADYYNKNG